MANGYKDGIKIAGEDVAPRTIAFGQQSQSIARRVKCVTIEAVKQLALLEGLLVDPVYTGKAMAGLFDMVRSGKIDRHESVVFLHTGGTPALFASADTF